MFAAAKRAAYQTAELKAGRWGLRKNIYLQGKTIGVIGTGNTGAEVARIANTLGMRVIAWTYNPSPERAKALGVEFVELDDLLRESDVVSIQVRLSDDSREMLGAARVPPHEARRNIRERRPRRAGRTPAPWSMPSTRATWPGLVSTSSTRSPCRPTTPSSPASRSSSPRTSPTRPPKESKA